MLTLWLHGAFHAQAANGGVCRLEDCRILRSEAGLLKEGPPNALLEVIDKGSSLALSSCSVEVRIGVWACVVCA